MTDKKKRFPEWLRTVPLFILLCVLGGTCGYLGLSLSEQFIPDYASPWSVLLLPLLLYAAFLLQIILHEAWSLVLWGHDRVSLLFLPHFQPLLCHAGWKGTASTHVPSRNRRAMPHVSA